MYGVCACLYVCPVVWGYMSHMNVCMWRSHIRCLSYVLNWGILLNPEFVVSATQIAILVQKSPVSAFGVLGNLYTI